ncbi:MAG: HAMP domain-containing histidine kinase [Lachnospiraceae bacterium]|nr:HAMP domain-containing histidine kinase [Lachnospiraceae bacterium]
MNKQTERELFRKWSVRYMAALAVTAFGIFFLYSAGAWICSRRVWRPYDAWYAELKWMKLHGVSVGLLVLLCFSVVFTLYQFRKISLGMESIGRAVNQLYSEKNDVISLPISFANLEHEMNQIRIKHQMNAQAAREANQRKNDMIMYMAHDLKTPLTSIIGYLTLVCKEADIPKQAREKYCNIALKKSLRLEELINEFFDITRFNFSHMILEKANVNLSVMLWQMLSEFAPQFQAKGLTVSSRIEEKLELLCDIDKMERVFDNLLKNIVNYSYENTQIVITLRRVEKHRIQLITENRGKTIPEEMLEHIFEQFFRMDNSRSSDTGGSGLGLAVTKEIVSLHGGTIVCESESEWIRFIMTLPQGAIC